MWRWVLVALAGCRFEPIAQVSTADDAPLLHDVPATKDAPPACQVVLTGSASGGALGNPMQGGGRPDVTCAAGELVIGLSFDVTTSNPPGWNQHVVARTHVRCGKALRSGSAISTVPAELLATTQSSCPGPWSDLVIGPELACPSGSVVVGMTGNVASNGSLHTLFNTVAIQCAALSPLGVPMLPATTIAFPETGGETDRPQVAMCDATRAVFGFKITGGCGQDSLALQCTLPSCQ